MTFKTNIAQYETATGDKLLYPFGPPIFQCEVDEKFTKDLIEEGRKLDIKNNDFSSNLAGNLKYGRSYHYKKEFTLKATRIEGQGKAGNLPIHLKTSWASAIASAPGVFVDFGKFLGVGM